MKISLRKSGENVEILKDGKRVSTAAADSAEKIARGMGGEFLGFDDAPKGDGGVTDITPGIGSSASIRQDIKKRGEDPNKIQFKSEGDFQEFKERVQPEGGIPQRAESRVDEFTRLKEKSGIEGLEDKIAEREAEIDKLDENFEKFRIKEEEGQTAGFATGRIQEEERNVKDRQRALQREVDAFNTRLKTKNNAIETVMNLGELDFQDARKEYESEFNKNLAVQSAFRLKESAEKTADRATYNTLVNMFAQSGKSYEDMTPKQQQQISELEIRTGLPTGTFQSLATTKPKANIIQSGKSTDERGNEFAWMIVQGEDGTPEIVTTATGGFKKPTGAKKEEKSAEFDSATDFVSENKTKSREQLKADMTRQFTNLSSTDMNTILDAAKIEKTQETKVKLSSDDLVRISKQVVKAASKGRGDTEKKLSNATALIEKNKIKQKWTDRQVELLTQAVKNELGI